MPTLSVGKTTRWGRLQPARGLQSAQQGIETSLDAARQRACATLFKTDRHKPARRLESGPTAGVTLLEMMIVVTLIALVAGLAYPSVSAGVDSLRLRSASDAIVGFLNTALERAGRRQQAVEVEIIPKENALLARSADLGFQRRLDVPEPIRITDVAPHAQVEAGETRRFLLYPGGAPPHITIEIATSTGRKRLVAIDPITGVSQAR